MHWSPFDLARTAFRAIRKRRYAYTPIVEIEIDAEAIRHNARVFAKASGCRVAPVLKSNAYGHGLMVVARAMEHEDVPFFCVDSYFEALVLRNEGIRVPILILGYTSPENISRGLRDIAYSILGMDQLRRLASTADHDVTVHLKIDTGMHRHGILPEELDEALALIKSNEHIRVEGVFSHFADADTENSPHAAMQIERWNAAAARLRRDLPSVKTLHFAATAGSYLSSKIDADTIRLGKGLYGVNATPLDLDLRPVLEMRTIITTLRTLPPGDHIGYNATFRVEKPMRVATIPVGYNEGVDRHLSNAGFMLVHGVPCPIVGRVSMNITSIDVSAVPDARFEDTVVVISKDPKMPNSIERIAKLCGTIPYEIMVHVPPHLRRTVVNQ